jgi:TPR repeat protein
MPTTAMLAATTMSGYRSTAPHAMFTNKDKTPCDEYAAAFYDPDRYAQGVAIDRINPSLAFPACTDLAAKRNSLTRAHYQLGRALYSKGDFRAARRELEMAVSKGYEAASVDLALLLADPRAGMLDLTRAIGLYQRAWDHKVVAAGYELGMLYESGRSPTPGRVGLTPDPKGAWIWYEKAAAAGEPSALARIAEREENAARRSVSSIDSNALLLRAFQYYSAAAERGNLEGWPDETWRNFRYRRATLARLLAKRGLMEAVAQAYQRAIASDFRVH